MSDPELESLVKEAVCLHLHRLAQKGGSHRGPNKARSREHYQRARRRRTAKQAARKRDFSTMGKCGGANATGAKKARPPEVARLAALVGVAKRRERAEIEAKRRAAAFVADFKSKEREKVKAFRETWFTK